MRYSYAVREVAPAAEYVTDRRATGHRSAARAPEIDSVTGELISGNMAAVVRGSYFGLENSASSRIRPLPRPLARFPSVSRLSLQLNRTIENSGETNESLT